MKIDVSPTRVTRQASRLCFDQFGIVSDPTLSRLASQMTVVDVCKFTVNSLPVYMNKSASVTNVIQAVSLV